MSNFLEKTCYATLEWPLSCDVCLFDSVDRIQTVQVCLTLSLLLVFVALGRRMCHQKCATLSPTRCTLDRRLSFSSTLRWAAENPSHRTSRTSWNWSSRSITACRGNSCGPVVGRRAFVASTTRRAFSMQSSIRRGNVCLLHCRKPLGK